MSDPGVGESKERQSPSSGRWWEGYLVRYLTGAFVGAIMLLVSIVLFKVRGELPNRCDFVEASFVWKFMGVACLPLILFGRVFDSGNNFIAAVFILALPALWVVVSQWESFCWLVNAERQPAGGEFCDFYRNLSEGRRQQKTNDFRESYTHLREHANSVFIVCLEISFLSAIWFIYYWTSSTVSVLAFVAIWLVPNIFLWGQANRWKAR